MKKWITTLSLLLMASTSFGSTLFECENQILEAAQTKLDLKVKAYKIPATNAVTGERGFLGGTLKQDTLRQTSESSNGLTAKVVGEDIGSYYQIDVKVGNSCSIEDVVISDLGPK